jgi:folate-binding protein YgfZ
MIDHCFLFAKTDQEILLVSSHQDPLILLSWLEQFHFVENLSIEDKSNHYIFSYGLGNGIHNTAPTYPICASKFLTHEDITIVGTLADHTAHTLSLDAWESLRIMCMLPKSPNEINDGMMPQNINLTSFISETKGCFIGQEVIAKARTYQKHVKTLSGIAVEEDVFKLLRSGLNVINSDGQTGEITSVAPFYVPGEVNALLLCDFSATRARVADALTINATFHCKT